MMTGVRPWDTAPLSFQQEETVRNLVRYPDCIHRYDMVCLFRLDGNVDRAHLTGAVEDLVTRHAVLRTVIGDEGDGSYVQRVHPGPGTAMPVRGWQGRTDNDVLSALIAERHGTDEVLSGAPLFRPALHEIDDARLLSFTVHHLVYDGSSLPLLWRDLSEHYRARLEERPAALPELPLSYADFARAQRAEWPRVEEEALGFWRGVLEGSPKGVTWPTPSEPPAVSTPREIVKIPFALGPEVSSTVRAAARATRVSPFMVLLCATAVAISRATGEHDLVFATDTANREDRTKRDAVGFYVNSKPARVRVRPGERFTDLLGSVWSTWLAADAYRDAYADQILHAFGSPRVIKVNMFNFSYGGYETPLFPEVRVTAVPVHVSSPDWRDFSLFWGEEAKQFNGVVLHRPAHVNTAVAEGVTETIRTLLADPDVVV